LGKLEEQMIRQPEAPEAIGDGPYRRLVDSITDYAIYRLDPTGVIMSWNSGAERVKGYAPAEAIGRNFSSFYTPEDRAAGLPQRGLAIAARDGRFENEGWRVRKNGSYFWAHVVIDAIRSDSGEVVGFAKITRDLTERRQAEQALATSREQFRLLVQGVSDYAIYMLDPEGRITNWNSGAERIKGYRAEEIVGQHFSRFYTEEDRAAGLPSVSLGRALSEGRYETEGWRVRKDGTRFWANVVIDPIRDDGGETIGFAKVTRDVTERRKKERELEAARDALWQSRKLEAIGQLTGGVAHDFNNLLMAILGSLEIVQKRQPFDPRVTPFVENAIHAARRGATLTQRLLAFARRQDLRRDAIDVVDLIGGLVRLVATSEAPGISLQLNVPDNLPLVETDGGQLESALLNLVVNARDAMPDGGAITLGAAVVRHEGGDELDAGEYVRVGVTDTGSGMDEETLARAMEPFFTTKGVGKGVGLGLSMVHGLAVQSGGRFSISSRPGEGTTAEIWLPVASEVPDARSVDDSESSPSAVSPRRLSILVVDDDPLVLLNTVTMLEDDGHSVASAISAHEALSILRSGRQIDLVISDQAMPEMTGAELVSVIRADWPDVPVIIATGYAELTIPADRDLPKLTKPFDQRDLARAIALTIG
jgi:PAS domain S-box-containing protein